MARKPSILIVEDEVGPRESLLMVLKPLYEVHTAETGKRALEVLSEKRIDGVTLDLNLPDTTGSNLLGEIRRNYPSIEVIIITGHSDIETARDAVNLGAFSFLLKPYNIGDVLHCVNKAVDKKIRFEQMKGFLTEMGNLIGFGAQMGEGIKRLKEDNTLLEKVKDMFGGTEQEAARDKWKNQFDFLRLLIETIENEDPLCYGHSSRVNYYCDLIARQIHLGESDREELQLGAYLHDIGRVGINRKIILKTGKYTKEELKEIQKHPEIGVNLVSPLNLPPQVISIIRHHHEYYDGRGYPDGIGGDEIPPLAAIVAVADAFDAMISDYPYKFRTLPIEEAAEELKAYSGTQFHPEYADVLIKLIKDEDTKLIFKAALFSTI